MAINGSGGNPVPPQITNIVEQQSFLGGKQLKSLDMDAFHQEPTEADITQFMDPKDTRGKKFRGMGRKK